MKHIRYQHLNQNGYVSVRRIEVTQAEYDKYDELRLLGYSITTEHDEQDRVLVTVMNESYHPSIEKFCSYADRDSIILYAINALYTVLVHDQVPF